MHFIVVINKQWLLDGRVNSLGVNSFHIIWQNCFVILLLKILSIFRTSKNGRYLNKKVLKSFKNSLVESPCANLMKVAEISVQINLHKGVECLPQGLISYM